MKTPLFFGLALATATATILVACSDGEDRPTFESPDVEAGAAVLPDAAPRPDVDVPDTRPPFDPKDAPVVCGDAGPCATALAAGDDHVCALLADGTVRCWGDDTDGALGGANDAGVVSALTGIAQISVAGATGCARSATGQVSCWGSNRRGQLGRDGGAPSDEARHPAPAAVALPGPASRVDVGFAGACAILADGGAAYCWGDNTNGQLARVPSGIVKVGPAALGSSPIARVVTASDTSLALGAGGELSTFGVLGGDEGVVAGRISSLSPDPAPSQVLMGVSSFAVTGTTPGTLPPDAPPFTPLPPPSAHACAVVGGAVLCWGRSARGALCTGLPDPAERLPTPAPITGEAYAQQIAAGGDTTCVRMTDGTVQCCGDNVLGTLGRGTAGPFTSFFGIATALTDPIAQIAATREAVCALATDGSISCWGGNAHGELHLGARDSNAHPTPIGVVF